MSLQCSLERHVQQFKQNRCVDSEVDRNSRVSFVRADARAWRHGPSGLLNRKVGEPQLRGFQDTLYAHPKARNQNGGCKGSHIMSDS